jgi:hypothetical protein
MKTKQIRTVVVEKKADVESETMEEAQEEAVDTIVVKPHCRMLVYENEETGEIEMVYGKGCKEGYIEKIAGKIAIKGIRFRPEKEEEKE